MNRRDFLVAGALAACTPTTRRLRAPEPLRPEPRDPRIEASNLAAPTLFFADDTLLQIAGSEQRLWNAATMTPTYVLEREAGAFMLGSDGALLQYTQTERGCAVRRTDGGREMEHAIGCADSLHRPVILRAARPDQLYVVANRIILIEIGDAATVTSRHDLTGDEDRAQAFAYEDGRIVVPGDELYLVDDARIEKRAGLGRTPRHLARGTNSRFWFTHALDEDLDWQLDELALADLAAPAQVITPFALGPGRIIDIASFDDGVLILVHTRLRTELRWEVAVLTEGGKVRWHALVPPSFARLDLNVSGAVALSATRAVLANEQHELLAWDAQTGATVAVTNP